MLYIVYVVHVVICLFLIMVVLLQQGSGADLSVFGGGGTQTAFGARSATSLLHKLTVAGFVGFILTTIAFGFLSSGGPGGSVMSDVEQTATDKSEAEGVATSAESAPETAPQEPAAEAAGEAAPAEADKAQPTNPGAADGP